MSTNEMTTKIEQLRAMEAIIADMQKAADEIRDDIKSEMARRGTQEMVKDNSCPIGYTGRKHTYMKQGEYIRTPRFGTVKIQRVYDCRSDAQRDGYTEPTYYDNSEYGIAGKSIDINRMIFAAYKKNNNNN